MNAPWAYLNGEWISRPPSVSIDDMGFLLGATVTERFRTFGGTVFRCDEHLARMRHSLEIIGLDAEGLIAELSRAVPDFLKRNHGHITPDDDWSIVAFVTPGLSGADQPTVCVHGHPLPFHRWAALYEAGLPVIVSEVRQVPASCWPPELKCRSRMHYYLADREADQAQPGARAILLDQDGYVGEATTANVIVFRAGEGLVSPPAEHILVGVSLGVVRELAAKIGVPFVTRRLSVDELRTADEAMFASTSICLLPIVTCDGRPLGTGQPGATYRHILSAWSDLVGFDVTEQARRNAQHR